MRILPRVTVNPIDAIRSAIRPGDVAWSRLVILVEVLAFLAFAVALTIAPQITLGAVASLASRASSLAIDARPAVAAFGLVLVGLATLGLRAITLPRRAESSVARPLEFVPSRADPERRARDAA